MRSTHALHDTSSPIAKERYRSKLADCSMVLETHAGMGKLFATCYGMVEHGVALEKNHGRAEYLALQRPTWRVYQCDSELALSAGLLTGLQFDGIDIDPYGAPWRTFEAICKADILPDWSAQVVMTDGSFVRGSISANTPTAYEAMVNRQFGQGTHRSETSVEANEWLTGQIAERNGYTIFDYEGERHRNVVYSQFRIRQL